MTYFQLFILMIQFIIIDSILFAHIHLNAFNIIKLPEYFFPVKLDFMNLLPLNFIIIHSNESKIIKLPQYFFH